MKQMTLISFLTDKLNLCLIQVLQYCFQFSLDIRHQLSQLNIVSDALSCLLNKIADSKNQPLDDTLKNIEIHIYHTTVIEMSSEFQNKIKKIYSENKQ